MSSPLSVPELRTGIAYEAARTAARAELATRLPDRRVTLGGDLVLVFEGRDSVRLAAEEALRSERVTDPARVAAAVAAFNLLLPPAGSLAATLHVDASDPARLAERLEELSGVERSLTLVVAELRSAGSPAAPVVAGAGAFHLHFAVAPAMAAALETAEAAVVEVNHPAIRVRGRIAGPVLRELLAG